MGAYSPAPVDDAGAGSARHARDHRADRARHGGGRAAVQGRAVRRADDRQTPEGRRRSCWNTTPASAIRKRQVLMKRLMSDLLPALVAARDGVLKNFQLRWYDDSALCVVMAARGLSRRLPQGHGDPRPGRGRRPAGRLDLPRRHGAVGRRPCAGRRRPGARRHRHSADACATPRRWPMKRWTASTGRKASAAATSAGARSTGADRVRTAPP